MLCSAWRLFEFVFTRRIRWLDLHPTFRDRQRIPGQRLRLFVKSQLKAIGQQGLQHRHNLLAVADRRARVDIEALPRPSTSRPQ